MSTHAIVDDILNIIPPQGFMSLTVVDTALNIELSLESDGDQKGIRVLENLKGLPVVRLVRGDMKAILESVYKRILTGKSMIDWTDTVSGVRLITEYHPIRNEAGKVTGATSVTWAQYPVKEKRRLVFRDDTPDEKPTLQAETPASVTETTKEVAELKERLVKQEKQALLGRLLAGIAHELNTPIGAVIAGASNLQDIFPPLMAKMQELFNPNHSSLLKLLPPALEALETPHFLLSSVEKRKAVRSLEAELDNAGIAEAHEQAQRLVDLGLQQSFEAFIPILSHPGGEKLISFIEAFGQARLNASNINLAAQKAGKLVKNLKEYNSTKKENSLAPVDVKHSIDTMITLYHNAIKYGVELDLKLADQVFVLADSDHLGQVWSNMINNSLQAMNHKGKLSITLEKQDSLAKIKITDNGPGIPDEIKEQIFEPFFSTATNNNNQNNGLGLSICRDIVESYGGKLSFVSEPGRTTFMVDLPIASN